MAVTITKAKREKLKAAIALMGASGSGKTLTALILAKGIIKEKYPELDERSDAFWEKIGIVDAEHNRSKLYAETQLTSNKEFIGQFLHVNLEAPYSVERYREHMMALISAGAEVVIVDSISHAWDNTGGILEVQQQAGGRFQDWKVVKPIIREFYRIITELNVHVISTIRTKQEYVADQSATGQMSVVKLGLKPIQKDDIEYELQITFMIDMTHQAQAMKDNSGMFSGDKRLLTVEDGADLFRWLEKGEDMTAKREAERQGLIEEMKPYLETKNIVLKDYITRLLNHADKTFNVGIDITTYPVGTLRDILTAIRKKESEGAKK